MIYSSFTASAGSISGLNAFAKDVAMLTGLRKITLFAEQISGLDAERVSYAVQHQDTRIANSTLKAADIGSVYVSAMSELFLRYPSFVAKVA